MESQVRGHEKFARDAGGARLVIYETANRKSAVGTATVISVDASDPKVPVVKIKAGKAIAKPWSLAEIKADKLFAGSPLIREGRLWWFR